MWCLFPQCCQVETLFNLAEQRFDKPREIYMDAHRVEECVCVFCVCACVCVREIKCKTEEETGY